MTAPTSRAARMTPRSRGRHASRGCSRACRGFRRCGRGRGPRAAERPTPNDATSGASGSVILSPTPPVECLSVVRFAEPGEVEPLARGDHREGEVADLAALHAVEEDRHGHGRHLLVGDVAAGVRVDQPVDLRGGERAAVALGADQVDGVEGFDATHESRHSWLDVGPSVRGPKASGITSSMVRMPDTVSSSMP